MALKLVHLNLEIVEALYFLLYMNDVLNSVDDFDLVMVALISIELMKIELREVDLLKIV